MADNEGMTAEDARYSSYRITEETIEGLFTLWRDPAVRIEWKSLFVLPPWLKAWGRAFGADRQPALWAVWNCSELIGVAPYAIIGETVYFWGSGDVCDYLDVIVVPGKEQEFFNAILTELRRRRVRRLSFESLPPDSITMTHLPGLIRSLGGTVSCQEESVALGLPLPSTWDAYLALLSGKERHEVRRKMRRVHETGDVRFRTAGKGEFDKCDYERFLEIFSAGRSDKAHFMTETMTSFFRDLIIGMAQENLLRLFFLDLNNVPVATALCFDYGSRRFLYNSGYHNQYRPLSVGLVCKVLSIKHGIEHGLEYYDFLKGAESYKSRLGGKPVELYRCCAEI